MIGIGPVEGSSNVSSSAGLKVCPPSTGVTSARNHDAAVATEPATSSPTAPKCQKTGTPAPAAQAPAPAPATVPRLKAPCSRGMMCRRTARSTAAPSTFEAVFQLAVPSPITASPAATASGLTRTEVPRPARTSPAPTMMLPIRMVCFEPNLSTISPDAETEMKDPSVMHSSRSPMFPGVRSSPSRMAGNRDTQVANAMPLTA